MKMNWKDILKIVQDLDDRFRSEGSVSWYRGHRDANWQLKSALHRHIERLTSAFTKKLTEEENLMFLRDEYKSLYRKFKADAWPLLSERERSEWGIIFAMQHFGIPTRLLDWTGSFACAIFFAQMRRKPTDAAAIWVLDPQILNQYSIEEYGILQLDEDIHGHARVRTHEWHPKYMAPDYKLTTIAVAPIFTNPRMVSQRSAFTLAGDDFAPLDSQLNGRLIQEERLVKIILPPETFDDAENYLSTAGIDAFTYYPDLEGLALKHEAYVEREIREVKKYYPKYFE